MLSKGVSSGAQVSGEGGCPSTTPALFHEVQHCAIWRGPQMLPGQVGGSAPELGATWEPLSSRLDPGGALQLG